MAKRWTPEEDELLLKLRGEGLSAKEICARLIGRTLGATKMRLSLLAPDKQKVWSQEEKDLVFLLKSQGHTNKYIAKKVGRSPSAIATFVSKYWHSEQL